MTEISKFEEAVAYTPITGVCVPRQRLMVAKGWSFHIDTIGEAPLVGDNADA